MTRLGPLVLPWSGAPQGPCLRLRQLAGSWRLHVLHRFGVLHWLLMHAPLCTCLLQRSSCLRQTGWRARCCGEPAS